MDRGLRSRNRNFFRIRETSEPANSQIHIPESTKKHLQRLSIQEINLYEQEQTESEPEATEVLVCSQSEHTESTNVTDATEVTEAALPLPNSNTDIMNNRGVEKTHPDDAIVLPSVLMEVEDTATLEHTHSIAANNPRFRVHQAELRQMAVFCISMFTMSLLPYTSPAFADYRPWKSNEAPPRSVFGHSNIK